MADFIKELVKKDRFPIFFITYFAFYVSDCIIIIIIIIRAVNKLLGNFWATFQIWSNF